MPVVISNTTCAVVLLMEITVEDLDVLLIVDEDIFMIMLLLVSLECGSGHIFLSEIRLCLRQS